MRKRNIRTSKNAVADKKVIKPAVTQSPFLLEGIRVHELSCKLGDITDKLPDNNKQEISIQLFADETRTNFDLRMALAVSVSYDADNFAKPAFYISTVLGIKMKLVGKLPSALKLETALSNTALIVLWPYWREIAQTCYTRMGLPGYMLPLVTSMKVEDGMLVPNSKK